MSHSTPESQLKTYYLEGTNISGKIGRSSFRATSLEEAFKKANLMGFRDCRELPAPTEKKSWPWWLKLAPLFACLGVLFYYLVWPAVYPPSMSGMLESWDSALSQRSLSPIKKHLGSRVHLSLPETIHRHLSKEEATKLLSTTYFGDEKSQANKVQWRSEVEKETRDGSKNLVRVVHQVTETDSHGRGSKQLRVFLYTWAREGRHWKLQKVEVVPPSF